MTLRLKNIFAMGVLFAILIAVLVIYMGFWSDEKAKKIELGLSDSNFPFRDYTQEELMRK